MKCLNCDNQTSNPKFCSRSCSASHTNKLNPKRVPTNKCSLCSIPILASKKFCSDFCKTKYKELNKNPTTSKYANVKDYRKRIKLKAVDYLGGKCILCNYKKSIRALSFHHINPSEKEFSISSSHVKWATLKSELDKCILVCSNCHSEIHEGLVAPDLISEAANISRVL